MQKPTVALFGSSGTMGIKAFKGLWKRKNEFNIILLVRPSKKNKKLFRSYEKEKGIRSIPSAGVVEQNGFKIVWGDATRYEDVKETVNGADWVLNCMALISPTADYCQNEAYAVNTEGIQNIVTAIESEPGGPQRIKLIHTSSVATMGDRMGPIRYGRIGDPVFPSIYDYYAITKIAGERIILESKLRYWAILRMTFIMPTDFAKFSSLLDPILFHMPLDTCMENTTDRDAGYGLIKCLDVSENSDFWRRVYNFGGGPSMRCTGYEYLNLALSINGISSVEDIMDRNWFALRNFHLQLYLDSVILNDYLQFQRDTLESWKTTVIQNMPRILQFFRTLTLKFPIVQKLVNRITRKMMKDLAENHRNGTRHWYINGNVKRITAFYKDLDTYESISPWNLSRPWDTVKESEKFLLDHGYDENKNQLNMQDLHQAANFRGGILLSEKWDGDMFKSLEWECCLSHKFTANPNTVLKTGHWCPKCAQPPWKHNEIAKKNPYFAQVWHVMHDRNEYELYTLEECQDIAQAHLDKKKAKFSII
ncbi:MAG: NAD(P)-dependent oxidoreductase [Candidatus Lokiarchaeota archaeon]|nr:NAD(P)-dependent oxidoreductase [Candidatus Lokiarchaeota archaeon]